MVQRSLQVVAAVVGLYLISFVCVFEVFSSPVRDEAGWLGPKERFHPQTIDLGKVHDFTGTDLRTYRFYRPLCLIWIWVNGLD